VLFPPPDFVLGYRTQSSLPGSRRLHRDKLDPEACCTDQLVVVYRMILNRLSTTFSLFSMLIALFGRSIADNVPSASTFTTAASQTSMNMTVCTYACKGDCKTYITPVDECFSSATLFPDDPSWSGLDVYDRLVGDELLRTIYHTADGSCTPSDNDDRFQIDLNTCVGPFGRPRPWGIFSILPTSGNDKEEVTA
jgi:hypothetical protein